MTQTMSASVIFVNVATKRYIEDKTDMFYDLSEDKCHNIPDFCHDIIDEEVLQN